MSAEVLEGIHNALLRSEEEKRRMELESRLYRKWRQGEDRVLFESKSNQEAMAKMNWLDKQVTYRFAFSRTENLRIIYTALAF